MFYHRVVVAAHKVVKTKAPLDLHLKMTTTHPYSTRQATSGGIRFGEQFDRKSSLARNSFCYMVGPVGPGLQQDNSRYKKYLDTWELQVQAKKVDTKQFTNRLVLQTPLSTLLHDYIITVE